ncbi:DgyrCDS8504 [Dimorphilus gyrociliatus]|uniref:DgyrCDS8504 n=1 Tax=Dimorphilus gyrociliatus TaxID=2664684 RepID=A0A7I8VWK5_9ANNE|nr:DgyrCDS8504 [Dimorphilus gyrociliatus]
MIVRILWLYLVLYNVESLDNYVNEWAAEIKGGEKVAREVAELFDFEFIGQIGGLEDHYLFSKQGEHRSRRAAEHEHTKRLADDPRVKWAEQQVAISRVKRSIISKRDSDKAYRNVYYNDKLFGDEWYLKRDLGVSNDNILAESGKTVKEDLGVIPCWAKGFTGKNVRVAILDDGLEHNHTDLIKNYDPLASTDLNGNDPDPFPRYDPTDENRHGTRCAGEVAMEADNKICGTGVAYDAKIGGIRMLDGTVTDGLEAAALSFKNQYVDIFSSSWGPKDNGKTMEGPSRLTSKALEEGAKYGRRGLGVIYVWASGNGGAYGDSCSCDGYTSSIYTLSVSSATQSRTTPWYSEKCPSTMTTAYSSGSGPDQAMVISTDLHNKCTNRHTGTSAAAPMAAGIFALVLQANPTITWRDLQHLVAFTSRKEPLQENEGWKKNGAGFWVNSRFGFGLLNAVGLVNAADKSTWENVSPQEICEKLSNRHQLPQILTSGDELKIKFKVETCKIRFLEHVVIMVNMSYTRRGDLHIILKSPTQTDTTLLPKRPADNSSDGLKYWPFMSVHSWGENPNGEWTLIVRDSGERKNNYGRLTDVSFKFYGTVHYPKYYTDHYLNLEKSLKKDRESYKNVVSPGMSVSLISAVFVRLFW